MKRSIAILSILLFAHTPPSLSAAPPPVGKGDLEISAAASVSVTRREGDTDTWIVLPIRVGSFLTDRLELEAEGLLTSAGTGDPGFLFSGLLSWHLPTPGGEHPYTHFLLFGAGVTNSLPISTNFAVGGGNDFAAVLNLGAGMKTFLAEPVAVRLEYRYQRYSFDRYPQSNHMVLVGLSYFVR